MRKDDLAQIPTRETGEHLIRLLSSYYGGTWTIRREESTNTLFLNLVGVSKQKHDRAQHFALGFCEALRVA